MVKHIVLTSINKKLLANTKYSVASAKELFKIAKKEFGLKSYSTKGAMLKAFRDANVLRIGEEDEKKRETIAQQKQEETQKETYRKSQLAFEEMIGEEYNKPIEADTIKGKIHHFDHMRQFQVKIQCFRTMTKDDYEAGRIPIIFDSAGVGYGYVFKNHIINITTKLKIKENVFYNRTDNSNFEEIIEVFEASSLEWRKLPSSVKAYTSGLRFETITGNSDNVKATTKKDFVERSRKNDAKKFIQNKYIKYGLNKAASKFSELNTHFYCDYVVKNFHPDSCMLTAIINKYYESFQKTNAKGRIHKELTYKRLAEILNIEYKKSDMAVSIIGCMPFFEKFKLGLAVYDYDLNEMSRYIPEQQNKDIYEVLYILCHDDHTYTMNENLQSLAHTKSIKFEDNIKVEKPLNDLYKIIDNKKEVIITYIEKADDMTDITIKYADDDVTLKFICNNAEKILCEVLKSAVIPKIFFDKTINGFVFSSEEKYCIVEQFASADDSHQEVKSIDEYNRYSELNEKLYKKIMSHDLLSFHHDSVLEIEDLYKCSPMCKKFTESAYDKLCGLDDNKAYSFLLSELRKVPVFAFWDVYQKYDGHEIEDLTLYIVETCSDTIEQTLLLPEKFSRVYGFILKQVMKLEGDIIDEPYEILQYRRPSKICDVDFSKDVAELYNDNLVTKNLKKFIVNKNIGLMGKKYNTKTDSFIFDFESDAKKYAMMYGGVFIPLTCWEGDGKKYILNVSADKRLRSGFQNMKDLIYNLQSLRVFEKYCKMVSIGVRPLGVRTDSIFFHDTDENRKRINENFKIDGQMGNQKIETDKELWGKMLRVEANTLTRFVDFTKPNIETIESEEEYAINDKYQNEVNRLIRKNKTTLIQAIYAGSGKSTCAKKYDKDVLMIAPYNVLCQTIQDDDFKAITLHKLLGIRFDGLDNRNMTAYDLKNINTICFDEVFLYPPHLLMKISRFMLENRDIIFIATGDLNQTEPVGFKGRSADMMKMINILFPNQILLTINKRMKTQADREKLAMLKDEILNAKSGFLDILKKFGFKTIKNIQELKTKKNICFYNERRAEVVNNFVHFSLLKRKQKYSVGDLVMVRKYFKAKKISVNTNYTFKIMSIDKDDYKLEDIVSGCKITVSVKVMDDKFKLPYTHTVDSIQGVSIAEDYTIFDIGSPFVDANYVWTMITRARNFNQITIFEHDEVETRKMLYGFWGVYFGVKCENYKKQDKEADRTIEGEYIDASWFINGLKECGFACKHCQEPLRFSSNTTSNITADRIDNAISHLKNNCEICCETCNRAMGNKK